MSPIQLKPKMKQPLLYERSAKNASRKNPLFYLWLCHDKSLLFVGDAEYNTINFDSGIHSLFMI